MTAKQMLSLDVGDKVVWGTLELTLVDWKCHHEPIFASDRTRIDAEPMFKDGRTKKNLPYSIHIAYWHEVKRC